MKSKLLLTLVMLFVGIAAARGQDAFWLRNRWKPTEYIDVQKSTPSSDSINPASLTAQWELEAVPGTQYVRLKNKANKLYLHIEPGVLTCGGIENGWWSAQWTLEHVPGTGFIRLRNRFKPDLAIHNQNGALVAGPIEPGWWSAQWELSKVPASQAQSQPVAPRPAAPQPSATAPAASQPSAVAQQPAPPKPAVNPRRSDNPGAFTPEHGGRIATAVVRYTDQIFLIGKASVEKGDKIYFFKQEMVGLDKRGVSFDPNDPAIGGQTFTVVETSPKLKLDRPMPNMRNTNNSNFMLVVEIYR